METAAKKRLFIFRWIDNISYFFGALAAIFLMVTAAIVVLEVFLRYVFNSPTIWVAETSVYLTMAVGLLAAAHTLKLDMHFSIPHLTDRLSKANRRRLKIVTHLMGMAYSIVFLVKGIQMAWFSYDMEDISTGLMETPLWLPNMLIPIAGLLLALQFFSKLVEEISNRNPS
jgi:TRAP-type C4-dicarboxylate transport system permease small subunit